MGLLMNFDDLKDKAKQIRVNCLKMIYKAKGGHLGCSLSEADILAVLFFNIMNYEPKSRFNDHFVLSKGHASEGLYCALALKNFIPIEDLDFYQTTQSFLTSHPTNKIPGIEVNTGALGHGLSISTGMAIGEKLNKTNKRVFCLTGDGELEEGSNWEALMTASHYKLDNLVLTVDHNGFQLNDKISSIVDLQPLNTKFDAFGWDVYEVDGNNIEDLVSVYSKIDFDNKRPHVVIARTTKGAGVSFMENIPSWHHKIPNQEEYQKALEELNG